MRAQSRIQEVFGFVERPSAFGHPKHCSECAEHNDTLLGHTPDSITFDELGNPGWDPICFIDDIGGFKYYLPALTRLSYGVGEEYYLGQFLFHLDADRVAQLERGEREVIAEVLEDIVSTIPEEIESNIDADEVLSCIDKLRGD